MGRNKRGRKRGNDMRNKTRRSKEEWEEMKKQDPELGQPKPYHLAPKTNETFEKYYKGQGIVPEEEWVTFMDTIRKQLPTTFRISAARNQAQALLQIIKGQYFNKFIGKAYDGRRLEPQSLPWYPDEMGWQLDFTKKEIRQNEMLKPLHGFLVSETESGNISRQEAVSMIPPLLMDIEPHHKILDMCAAPGSKTAQLIEMLHKDGSVPVPDGFVVANDMDNKRCYLMTHQVKRIQSPNCMIINHDARILPNMTLSKEENAEFVKYDRILCDVPCSGDGTVRKNPDIWQKWHVNGAHNLHKIQKKVLQRGLELLAVGGRLVYSTCSLNPIENEAVIYSMVKHCGGTVELVDVSDQLPGLNYKPGVCNWKILAKNGDWYEKIEDAPEIFVDMWDSTMYAPTLEEAQSIQLDRCIRVLPHQQNTGAFFIAVLKKTEELPWVSARTRRMDPTINTKFTDPSVDQEPGSDHFTFDVRGKTGLYLFARCNLCDKLCQSKHDYNAHKNSKSHYRRLQEVKIRAENTAATTEGSSSETGGLSSDNKTEQTDSKENIAMETQNTESKEHVNVTKESCDKNTGDNDYDMFKEEVKETTANVTASSGDNKEETDEPEEDGDGSIDGPPTKRSRTEKRLVKEQEAGVERVKMRGHKEDPFYFCSKDDPIWPSIQKFYNVAESFNVEQIMYRNMKRILYYVSKQVKNLVICNEDKVKFINLGVKCFSNAPSPICPECDFRLSQEGLLAVSRHIQARKIELTKQDLITILSEENPFNYKLTARALIDVEAMTPGSAMFYFKPSKMEPEPNGEIVFCGWRGKTSVKSFVGKDERSHYLRLCGVELTDIQASVQAKKSGDTTRESCITDSSIVGDSTTQDSRVETSSGNTETPM